MTTIILVSVGVLLAAVAALMMFFYGGEAFNGGDVKAEAARLVGEGVQIQAAFQAFRAQEDRTPGTGVGVDARAIKDLLCKEYLDQVPKGLNNDNVSYTEAECANPSVVKEGSSPWKVDYTRGIARSVVGNAYADDGVTKSRAYEICQAARREMKLITAANPEPMSCDPNSGISNAEPCCIMSSADL